MRFLETPNLPLGRVTHVMVGEKYINLLADPLKKRGINIIPVKGSAELPTPVSKHADMLMHHLGRDIFVSSKSNMSSIKKCIPQINLLRCEKEPIGKYPDDVSLNVLRVGKFAFGAKEHVSPDILRYFAGNDVIFINVRQGYAKCSAAVVDEASVITADPGLCSALEKHNIRVLLISPGYMSLEGYNYGFIGGDCGKISRNEIAFTGVLDEHPDRKKIFEFLEKRKVFPVFLTNDVCFDVGSMIPVCEQFSA